MTGLFIAMLAAMIFIAFFAGTEIAYFSANRFKIELRNTQGELTAKILSKFMKQTPQVISSLMIGTEIAVVIYSLVSSRLIDAFFLLNFGIDLSKTPLQATLIQTTISTILLLVFAEYIPKIIFQRNADFMLNIIALPFYVIMWLLKPILVLTNLYNKHILYKIFGFKDESGDPVFSRRDLHQFVTEGFGKTNQISEIDPEAFSNALDFNQTRVRDIMIPRTEIVAVHKNVGIEVLRNKFIETEHSRILIYDNNLDHIIGYVHSIDLFRNPKTIEEVMQAVLLVPEGMFAHHLLSEFNQKRKGIGVAVDDFGGTAGIVTTEDLMEVVFGEIEDEFDEDEHSLWLEKKISDQEFIFSARHEIEYLNKKYGFGLPEGEFNTLSGMIMAYAERIPAPGEKIRIENIEFTIQESTPTKIDILHVKIFQD